MFVNRNFRHIDKFQILNIRQQKVIICEIMAEQWLEFLRNIFCVPMKYNRLCHDIFSYLCTSRHEKYTTISTRSSGV